MSNDANNVSSLPTGNNIDEGGNGNNNGHSKHDPDFISAKILFILELFPALSSSGLQVSIGPYIAAKYWKPVLEQLRQDGSVEADCVTLEAPDGRVRSYTRFFLAGQQPPVPSQADTSTNI